MSCLISVLVHMQLHTYTSRLQPARSRSNRLARSCNPADTMQHQVRAHAGVNAKLQQSSSAQYKQDGHGSLFSAVSSRRASGTTPCAWTSAADLSAWGQAVYVARIRSFKEAENCSHSLSGALSMLQQQNSRSISQHTLT